MKKQVPTIFYIAFCEDCSWFVHSPENKADRAALHAKNHKHKVLVRRIIGGFYDARDDKDRTKKYPPPNSQDLKKAIDSIE